MKKFVWVAAAVVMGSLLGGMVGLAVIILPKWIEFMFTPVK